jgi:hypothetical protein
MLFESRKAQFSDLSTGSAVRGGQNRGQDFGPKKYGPHAVHGGRKKLSGGEGGRGGGAARSILFGNRLPLQPKYECVGYAAIAKRMERIA